MKFIILLQFNAFISSLPVDKSTSGETTTVAETEPPTTDHDWTSPATSTTTDLTTTTVLTTTTDWTLTTPTTSTSMVAENSTADSTNETCFHIFSIGWCWGESNEATPTLEPSTTVFTTINDYLIVEVVVPSESSDEPMEEQQSHL